MKRCPECRRDYYDDTLSFCLADGTELVYGLSDDEPATAILSEPGAVATGFPASESPTRSQIHTTDQTAVFPRGTEAKPQENSGGLSEKQSLSTHRAVKRQNQRNRLLAILSIAVVLVVGGFLAYRYFPPTKQIESIAVMPFVNESGNADVEYLSDGMTETLISSLSQLPNLNVKPRSSVFRYKGKETNPQTIGKELNVQAILNGRVVQRGNDITLYVELIDAQKDTVLWKGDYNRPMTNLVALQSEIARDVSSKLKSKLSGAEAAKVEKNYTANPEAYQLYLKGSYYKAKYSEEGYKKAIEYFQQAIEKDSNYALAYADIAFCYGFASDWYLAPSEAMPKAKAAALKALELDDTLALAHSNLGSIAFWYEYDWATSERELLRSIELDPASSHRQYGHYLAAMGRLDEAIREGETALRYSPLDLFVYGDLAWFYNFAGRPDQAIETAHKGIEVDRNHWGTYQILGLAYARKRQFPEAIAALEKARSFDNNLWINGCLGYVYALAGRKADARRIADELKEISKQRFVSPYNIAVVYAGLNERDQTFEWLNKAYETRSLTGLFKVEPFFENMRDDPRFKEMLKRLNLPE